MMLDTLDNAPVYRTLHPKLARGLDWLIGADARDLRPGPHVIDGERLFAIVDDYTTRPRCLCRLEAHRRYHDIQYIAEGVERIGYSPVGRLTELEPYDAERDIAFFTGEFDVITLQPGMFAIFTPRDAHAPQIAAGEPAPVRKIVVKVAVGDLV